MSINGPIIDADFFMPSVAQTLAKLQKASPYVPSGVLADIYLLCEAQGRASFTPDDVLLKDITTLDPSYWSDKGTIDSRKEYLERLGKSNYMKALIDLKDPMKAVHIFIEYAGQASAAMQARTRYSDIPANGSDYGGGYVSPTTTAGLSPGDEAEGFDAFMQAQETLLGLTDDDIAASFATEGWGMGGAANTYSPGRKLSSVLVSNAKALPTSFPLLMRSLNKIKELIGEKNLLVDSDTDQAKKRRDHIDESSQVSSADASDVASDLFDKKFSDKSLIIQKDMEEKDKQSHTFILLDVSGSMDACDLGGFVCRGFATNIICLGVLNMAGKNGMKVWILPFAGRPHTNNLKTASNRDEAITTARWIASVNYDGGGTDIEGAVLAAYKITTSSGEYDKADILLLTDGASPLTSRLVSEKPARTKLRTLIISNDSTQKDLTPLIQASDYHAKLSWDKTKGCLDVGTLLQNIGATDPVK